MTTGEKVIDLVKALDAVEGIQRYRISSLEPDLLSDELIDYCAQSRAFMPHYHIPLQSGSDTVLKLMHRHYDRQLFADKIHPQDDSFATWIIHLIDMVDGLQDDLFSLLGLITSHVDTSQGVHT